MITYAWVPHSKFEGGTKLPKGEYRVTYELEDHTSQEINGLTENNVEFVGKSLDAARHFDYTVHQVIRT